MLLMTALGDVAEVCKGLDLGADHYMVKPITLREVVARLNEAQAGVVIHTVRGLGYRLDAASDLPPQAEPD